MVYSLVEMARVNGINPPKYLEQLLEARPHKDMTDEELETLTPWAPSIQASYVNK